MNASAATFPSRRRLELEWTAPSGCITVVGPAGVGKSHCVAQWFAEAAVSVRPIVLLPGEPLDVAVARLRAGIFEVGTHPTCWLDASLDTLSLARACVKTLLEESCVRVVVSSRAALRLPAETVVTLGRLDESAARSWLSSLLPHATAHELSLLFEKAGGLPGPMQTIAALARDRGLSHALLWAGSQASSLRPDFGSLPSEHRQALEWLHTFAGPLRVASLRSLMGPSSSEVSVRRVCVELAELSLVRLEGECVTAWEPHQEVPEKACHPTRSQVMQQLLQDCSSSATAAETAWAAQQLLALGADVPSEKWLSGWKGLATRFPLPASVVETLKAQALGKVSALPSSRLKCEALVQLAAQSDFVEAEHWLDAARREAQALPHDSALAEEVSLALAHLQLSHGHCEQGRGTLEALSLPRDHTLFARFQSLMSMSHRARAAWGEAAECTSDAITLYDAAGLALEACLERLRLATLYLDLGERAAAAELLRQTAPVLERPEGVRLVPAFRVTHGDCAAYEGDVQAAEEHFQAALRCARAVGDLESLVSASSRLGFLAFAAGHYASARDWFFEVTSLSRRQGLRHWTSWLEMSQAAAEARLGNWSLAQRLASSDMVSGYLYRAEAELMRLHVPLCLHSRATAAGRHDEAQRLKAEVAASLSSIQIRGEQAKLHLLTLAADLDAMGLWPQAEEGPVLVLELGFCTVGGTRIELKRQWLTQRLLDCLVEHRLNFGEAWMPSARLIECLWPEGPIRPSSALNRLYVAISRFRALGFSVVLESSEEGYRFRPDCRLVDRRGNGKTVGDP